MNNSTDILTSKCFGQSAFLEKDSAVKTDLILTSHNYNRRYFVDAETTYPESYTDSSGLFNLNSNSPLEYVFYKINGLIGDSFTGNTAELEMFCLKEVNIPKEEDRGIFKNFGYFKNMLYTSPMYIEYLTLRGIKKGNNTPKITIEELAPEEIKNTEIYFKQPDIMLYNGEYILPRDIPSYLLLKIFALFKKNFGLYVRCFSSVKCSESPVANFINAVLYNHRCETVCLNFGSPLITPAGSNSASYDDTAVRLYRTKGYYDDYEEALPMFPEGSLLSDLSDMRCITADASPSDWVMNAPESGYFPENIKKDFFTYLSTPLYLNNPDRFRHPPDVLRRRREITENKLIALKSEPNSLYVYSNYSDYLKLSAEGKISQWCKEITACVDRLPEQVNGAAILYYTDEAKKYHEKMEHNFENFEITIVKDDEKYVQIANKDFAEPPEAFDLLEITAERLYSRKNPEALLMYKYLNENCDVGFSQNGAFGWSLNKAFWEINHKSKNISSDAEYSITTNYTETEDRYHCRSYGDFCPGEETDFYHIFVINNKVYAPKSLSGMELDMLTEVLKQPSETEIYSILQRAKLFNEKGSIFNLCDKYIKKEYIPRTDSFHIQSITLNRDNFKPLCVTTIMAEDNISLNDYLSDVLGFFENYYVSEEEFETFRHQITHDGNLTMGEVKRYYFMRQCFDVFLNLYEMLCLKIDSSNIGDFNHIGDIVEDRYFKDLRDEKNNAPGLFSFELKHTRFDFMLHHEYDLYKNFTFSSGDWYEDKPLFTRPSYIWDFYLLTDCKINDEQGDDIKVYDLLKKYNNNENPEILSFNRKNPNNKYWYYEILLDQGLTGKEIRKRELLGYSCPEDLTPEAILNNLLNWYDEINGILVKVSKCPKDSARLVLYNEIMRRAKKKAPSGKENEVI